VENKHRGGIKGLGGLRNCKQVYGGLSPVESRATILLHRANPPITYAEQRWIHPVE